MGLISLNQLPMYTDEFSFRELNGISNKKDAIVMLNPSDAVALSPAYIKSRKTLEEHIEYVNKNKIRKAFVVAEDVEFIKRCPDLEYMHIIPAITAENFDYSPIYELKKLKWLQCETLYGVNEDKVATIDYSQLTGLKQLVLNGSKGNLNVHHAENIEALSFRKYPASKNLRGIIPGKSLNSFSLALSSVQSLDGIEEASQLCRLELLCNRSLCDISALRTCQETLGYLEINTCGKIKDFSVLSELCNLEYLILWGNNILDDVSFLEKMPKLKYLRLTMNVRDGNLRLCEQFPCVEIQNRRHYSHKNEDLPKESYTDPEETYPRNIV